MESAEELKERIGAEAYRVTQQKHTEERHSSQFLHSKEQGTFICVVCSQELFTSNTKYESGTGFPSFYQSVNEDSIRKEIDLSYGQELIEALCSKCGAHLGHVYDDGPNPTGKRYCINGVALMFYSS